MKMLLYDIAADKWRRKLADELETMGLVRLQKSVFVGELDQVEESHLLGKYSPKLEATDRLYVLRLDRDAFRAMRMEGTPADLAYMLGEMHTLIL